MAVFLIGSYGGKYYKNETAYTTPGAYVFLTVNWKHAVQYVSEHGVKALKEYKYSGVDKSITYRLFLRRFYQQFVKIFPRSVAPNTITLSGFMFMWASFFLMRYWQPEFQNPDTPWWVFVICGFNVVVYQTFDAVDGAHARRTGMGGPLGEMFDHGCDALNCVLLGMVSANMMQLGTSVQTVVLILSLSIAFFAATWDEYHTKTLYLGYINGVDEGLIMTAFTFFMTGAIGQWFWLVDVFPGFRVNDLFVTCISFGAIMSALGDLVRVVKAVQSTPPEEEIQSQEDCYLQWTPLVLLVSFFLLWTVMCSPHLLENNMWVLMTGLCFAFGNITSHLILAHLSREPYRKWNVVLLPPFMGMVNSLMKTYLGIELWEETGFILLFFVVSVFSFIHFVIGVIDEVCEGLGITAFSVPPEKIEAALAAEAQAAAQAENERAQQAGYQNMVDDGISINA